MATRAKKQQRRKRRREHRRTVPAEFRIIEAESDFQLIEAVDEGETVEVNGRRFTGPLYVARQSVLREISFVALSADDQTSARVAAGTQDEQATSHEIGHRPNRIEPRQRKRRLKPYKLMNQPRTEARRRYGKER